MENKNVLKGLAALIDIVDQEVPLGVIEDDIEEYFLKTESREENLFHAEIAKEEVPLVSLNIVENVKNCVLHFLELIVAAASPRYYVGSTRK